MEMPSFSRVTQTSEVNSRSTSLFGGRGEGEDRGRAQFERHLQNRELLFLSFDESQNFVQTEF